VRHKCVKLTWILVVVIFFRITQILCISKYACLQTHKKCHFIIMNSILRKCVINCVSFVGCILLTKSLLCMLLS
jgi:hypothetical protein